MRIKRQRRKLRGKYSGNCLSCAAKWSKCWYIASVDNQNEWETRLGKVVTPCADEVCFQCWDAKIRTSPKRKIHFKTELPPITAELSLDSSRPSKRVERNKRRALNADYTYNLDIKPSRKSIPLREEESEDTSNDDEMFMDEESEEMYAEEEDGLLFEEDAVFLLSTAFKTIPTHSINVNINFGSSNSISCLPEIAKQLMNEEFEDLGGKKRGSYYCGKCGKLKKGHVCASPPDTPTSSPPSPSSSSSPSSYSPPLAQVSFLGPILDPLGPIPLVSPPLVAPMM